MMFWLAVGLILLLTLLETPLFVSIAGLTILCLLSVDLDPTSLQMVLIEMNRLATMPVLVALPLFTLVGCILTESQAPLRLLNLLEAVAGWLPGGSALAALCACAFFTALTGASGVTIVALGAVLYPVLLSQQYSRRFSLGLLTTGGSLGLLFPPSLPIILYGVVAQINIGTIFKATLMPGLLLIAVLGVYAVACGRRLPKPDPSGDDSPARSWRKALFQAKWDILLVLLILAGVYGGYVTLAEVSAVAVVYVIIVECFILKEIHWRKQLPSIMVESTLLAGAIIIILGMALGFTGYLVDAQIPRRILTLLSSLTDNKWLFLAGLNLFLIAVGCIMDIFSAIVIVVPLVVPVAKNYGIDPYHLCAIFLVNLEIGYSTPPVGMNLFIASLKFGQPITALYRASLPFLLLLVLCLLLVTYLPVLSVGLLQ
jgi:C4-dicarboxylate transporter DctM subunit